MQQMFRLVHINLYNFDKTKFMIGIAVMTNVEINTDRKGQVAILQPFKSERVAA
jgi:hypothetical protein